MHSVTDLRTGKGYDESYDKLILSPGAAPVRPPVPGIDQVMAPIDCEMACIVHNHILSKGLKLYLKDGVKAFHREEKGIKVELQSGKFSAADMVILAIGVRPDVSLAKDAGLEIGERRGIKVNSYLQTSDPDIYAANNIYGADEQYRGTEGTSVAKVFDLTVAATGNSEKTHISKTSRGI
ncbi:MAG: NAD(P)/FAD-dependent oxidoreductase [Clostridia bacterium]|jgi:NAD(P)H-nitrite reductase large subunit